MCKCFRLVVVASLAMFLSCGHEETIPRAEHPRPDFERAMWSNLNGQWEFRFDASNIGLGEGWHRPTAMFERIITVPFCWESELSGVEVLSGQQIGWYRREFEVPSEWSGQRVWLRFEAVDWEATVWVNGTRIGSHEGGYTPFAFDITDQAAPGETATIVVRTYDPTDPELPTGMQHADWYTFASGIWQTVWLEARPETYLETLTLTPTREGDSWAVGLSATVRGTDGAATIRITSPDPGVESTETSVEITDGKADWQTSLAVTSPKLWTPETPNLYDLTVEVVRNSQPPDTVKSYFGLRTIGRGRYGDLPDESILLNGEPVYLRGALDQSYNPDGIYTAPSDEFLRQDIELAKSAGLNCLRIHVKADEPRRLYWADKLGLLILQDMPNTWEDTERARQASEQTLHEVVARDRNHPSIITWITQNLSAEIEELDPTRLAVDNATSESDQAANGSAPFLNAEVSAISPDGGDRDISWGFRNLTTQLRSQETTQGYVYRRLTDVEFEHDGLFNYDRSLKDYGYETYVEEMSVADLQGEDFVGFDGPPTIIGEPGTRVTVPVFVSHFSDRDGEIMIRPALVGVDDLGNDLRVELDLRPVTWERYRVTPQQPLGVTLPSVSGFTGALTMELLADGERIAANFVNIVARRQEPEDLSEQIVDRLDPRRVALRLDPRAYSGAKWTGTGVPRGSVTDKFFFHGAGSVEYRFTVPQAVLDARPFRLGLVAELGSKGRDEKRDWPQSSNPLDYPQTDSRKLPTVLNIRLNGEWLAPIGLPDDPADSRGVLSHLAEVDHGSYGYLVKGEILLQGVPGFVAQLKENPLVRVVFEVPEEESPNGLSVYGARSGRYPLEPTIVFETADDIVWE